MQTLFQRKWRKHKIWPWKESNNKNPQIVLRIILERTENDYETESPGNNKKLWIVVTTSVTY